MAACEAAGAERGDLGCCQVLPCHACGECKAWHSFARALMCITNGYVPRAGLVNLLLQKREAAQQAVERGVVVQDSSAPVLQQGDLNLYTDVRFLTWIRERNNNMQPVVGRPRAGFLAGVHLAGR